MSLIDRQYIYDRLQDSQVSALIADRIYPDALPQNVTYPCVSYLRVSTAHFNTLTGTPNLENPTIQLDCWAASHTSAWQVAEAVRDVMLGSTVRFHAQIINTQQFTESRANAPLFRVMLEFSIWFNEA